MSTQTQTPELTRVEVRKILKRHIGSIQEIASSFDPPVTSQAVTSWLYGRSKSARIAAAAQTKAQNLLEEEGAANAK